MTRSEIEDGNPVGRPRKHRMMRRAVAERIGREHKQAAFMLALERDNLPVWRWARRRLLDREIARNEQLAAVYGAFVNWTDPVPICEATTTARRGDDDCGKWRRCELPAGHTGEHKTTYCGHDYCWQNEKVEAPK